MPTQLLEDSPIVLAQVYDEPTDEDIDTYVRISTEALAKKRPHTLIIHSQGKRNLNAKQRRRMAEWVKSNSVELAKYRAGFVLVTESAFVRGLMTAVYWFAPPPYPYASFATLEEAWDWCRERLADKGTEVVMKSPPEKFLKYADEDRGRREAI